MGSACDDDVGGSQVMEVLLAVVGVNRRGCIETELDLSGRRRMFWGSADVDETAFLLFVGVVLKTFAIEMGA